MRQVGKWLVLGSVVVLAAAGIGLLVGYGVSAVLLTGMFYYRDHLGWGRWSHPLAAFLFDNYAAIANGCMVFGVAGGILLGVWLIRHLFSASGEAVQAE